MLYETLDVQLYVNHIKYSTVAEALGITVKTLKRKITGKTPFTWPEVKKIKRLYFNNIPLDVLFAEDGAGAGQEDKAV